MNYAEAVKEKAEMIALVRNSGFLRVDVSDEQIWSHWRELSRHEPVSAFDCTRSLNILATCDQLAEANVPKAVLEPIRRYAFGKSDTCRPHEEAQSGS